MTKQQKLALAGAAVLVAAGVVFLLTRGGGGAAKAKHADAGPAKTTKTTKRARPKRAQPPMPGVPQVSADDDPVDTLRLEGQVVDDTGAGVANALVRISSRPSKTTKTDGDGSFHFDKLVGRTYALSARAGRLVGGPVMHKLTDSSDPAVIRMKRGATVEMHVLGESAAPLSGALARIENVGLDATTDGKGVAVLEGVHTGYTAVVVSATGYAPVTELIQIPDNPGVRVKRTVQLKKGVPVAGLVVDDKGAPVAAASVYAVSASSLVTLKASAVATTNAKGQFELPAVATGAYRLVASHKDYAAGQSSVVSVYETAIRDVRIQLQTGATISGRVVDDSGKGVAWATVRTGPEQGAFAGGGGVRETVADADGAFVVRRLHRIKHRLVAKTDAASSTEVVVDLTQIEHKTGVVLTLNVKGTISGRVVDGNGDPVAEVQVTAIPDFWGGEDPKGFAVRGVAMAATGGGGKFVFRGLPEGRYRLKATRRRINRSLFARPGKKARTGDENVELVLLEDGGIKGKLAFDNGDPVKVFVVTVSIPPGVPVDDKHGRFHLSNLAAGKQLVSFRGPNFAPQRTSVDITPNKVVDLGTITVKKGRSVSGRVVDAGGSPVAKATVIEGRRLMGDGTGVAAKLGGGTRERAGIRTTTTDDDGYYQISGIGDGRRYIVAEHDSLGRSLPYVIAANVPSPRLDIRLRPYGSLEGKVTKDGVPAAKVAVFVTPKATDGGQHILVQTAADGTYAVEHLPAGEHRVLVWHGTGIQSSSTGKDVTIRAGEKSVVNIDITGGSVTLEVTVVGKNGAKIDVAQVLLAHGTVSWKNGLEAQRSLLTGAVNGKQAMVMDMAKPAVFEKVAPGAYSACVVPISGDISDPTFAQKLQQNATNLRVYCTPYTVTASPATQSLTLPTPAMDPLP